MRTKQHERVNLKEEILHGAAAGVGIIFLDHPFDTVKTRIQIMNQGMTSAFKNLVSKEGYLSLYKGIGFPLWSSILVNAIVFSTYNMTRNYFDPIVCETTSIILSGMMAGFFSTFVQTPVDLVKIKQQMYIHGHDRGPNCFRVFGNIYRRGGITAVYHGLLCCLLRDIPSYITQFVVYEKLTQLGHKKEDGNLYWATTAIAGGVAGSACWSNTYFADMIKSRIQSHESVRNYRLINGKFLIEVKNIYREHGVRGFFNGITLTCSGAFFANSFGFLCYEYSRKSFEKF